MSIHSNGFLLLCWRFIKFANSFIESTSYIYKLSSFFPSSSNTHILLFGNIIEGIINFVLSKLIKLNMDEGDTLLQLKITY